MSDFTIKLLGTHSEVQVATAKIEMIWGVKNIKSMSVILPSTQHPRQRFKRPFHRYICLDPHAEIAINDKNGNRVKAGPLSKFFSRKEARNG